MFYATYKLPVLSDICEFATKRERDDWVNFRDHVSKALKITPENAIFEREAISEEYFKRAMKDFKPRTVMDTIVPGQKWYLLSLETI